MIAKAFQKISDESGRKPRKVLVLSEFYNKLMEQWLQGENFEIYLTRNEGKAVITEQFIADSQSKIYKYITAF